MTRPCLTAYCHRHMFSSDYHTKHVKAYFLANDPALGSLGLNNSNESCVILCNMILGCMRTWNCFVMLCAVSMRVSRVVQKLM